MSGNITDRLSAADFRASHATAGAEAKKPFKAKRNDHEYEQQVLFFIWLDRLAEELPERIEELKDIWSSANGGQRNARTAGRLRAAGARKGVLDIEVMIPIGSKHAMFIELKSDTGKPSAEQKARIARLNARGYHAVIAVGWVEAAQALCQYLRLPWKAAWEVHVEIDRLARKGRDWLASPLNGI